MSDTSEIKNLRISTASITINVVKVDGHKMTKATFNQIPNLPFQYADYVTKKFNVEDFVILGWVNDDGLSVKNGNPTVLVSYQGMPFVVRAKQIDGYEPKFSEQLFIAT